jgi:hypothetical protein
MGQVPGANSQLPVIHGFDAQPTTLNPGQSSTLYWFAERADEILLQGPDGSSVQPAGTEGEVTVSPSVTTSYSLIARSRTASATKSLTVAVVAGPPVLNSFRAEPATIQEGQTTTLHWRSADVISLSINPGVAVLDGDSRSVVVRPQSSTPFSITGQNAFGVRTCTTAVRVLPAHSKPYIQTFSASSRFIKPGQRVRLSWVVDRAFSLEINGQPIHQGDTYCEFEPTGTTTYELWARNSKGSTKRALTVIVLGQEVDPPTTPLGDRLSSVPGLLSFQLGLNHVVPFAGWLPDPLSSH